jgi:hypothetical protein
LRLAFHPRWALAISTTLSAKIAINSPDSRPSVGPALRGNLRSAIATAFTDGWQKVAHVRSPGWKRTASKGAPLRHSIERAQASSCRRRWKSPSDCFIQRGQPVLETRPQPPLDRPRERTIQYSRDISDEIDRPPRTGYSAFAEYDSGGRGERKSVLEIAQGLKTGSPAWARSLRGALEKSELRCASKNLEIPGLVLRTIPE